MLPKNKELEKKVESYKEKVEKLKRKTKKLKQRNKKLHEEKRNILQEKKEILEKQGDQIKTLIKKMSDEDIEDLSEDREELIERLEKEVFNLKVELNELDEENEELIEELNEYEKRTEYVINTDVDLSLPEGTEIRGGVKSEGDIQIEDSVTIKGPVETFGLINIGDEVNIKGHVISEEGDIQIGSFTEIEERVKGESISFGEKSSATDIESLSDVLLEKNTEVDNIIAEGDVTMKKGSKADGKVEFGGEFDGAEGITIVGSLQPLSEEEIKEDLNE